MLNCFYTNDELLGMNLKGANSKLHPQKDILEGIYLFKQSHVLLFNKGIYMYVKRKKEMIFTCKKVENIMCYKYKYK